MGSWDTPSTSGNRGVRGGFMGGGSSIYPTLQGEQRITSGGWGVEDTPQPKGAESSGRMGEQDQVGGWAGGWVGPSTLIPLIPRVGCWEGPTTLISLISWVDGGTNPGKQDHVGGWVGPSTQIPHSPG